MDLRCHASIQVTYNVTCITRYNVTRCTWRELKYFPHLFFTRPLASTRKTLSRGSIWFNSRWITDFIHPSVGFVSLHLYTLRTRPVCYQTDDCVNLLNGSLLSVTLFSSHMYKVGINLLLYRHLICWLHQLLQMQLPEPEPMSAEDLLSASYSSMQKVWAAALSLFDLLHH